MPWLMTKTDCHVSSALELTQLFGPHDLIRPLAGAPRPAHRQTRPPRPGWQGCGTAVRGSAGRVLETHGTRRILGVLAQNEGGRFSVSAHLPLHPSRRLPRQAAGQEARRSGVMVLPETDLALSLLFKHEGFCGGYKRKMISLAPQAWD